MQLVELLLASSCFAFLFQFSSSFVRPSLRIVGKSIRGPLSVKLGSISRTYVRMSDDRRSASAATAMVKKGKRKLVDKLLKEMDEVGSDHVINKFLNEGVRPNGVSDPVQYYERVTSDSKASVGALSVLAEFNKKVKTGFLIGMPPPEIMGGVLRDAGAKAVVCSMDPRTGGTTPDEFYKFTKEQASARIFIPPPIPVIWNDLIIDKVQIAHAASLGASAIMLQVSLASSEELKGYVQYSKSFDMEPIALVETLGEAELAIEAGVRCLCLTNLEESGLIELRNQLPSNTGLQIGARFRSEAQFSNYNEIDSAWVLRDHGFSTLWPSPESLYSSGMTEILPTIIAMRSKASRVYMSPRQFLMDRKDEGAKEYLGDILY